MSAESFELNKQEYIKMKEEQAKRIGFRDNLLYVNLLLISGIVSFVFASDRSATTWQPYGLLLAAWVTLVLGWTYVVNDEKISSIGRYIRIDLSGRLEDTEKSAIFGWETAHRADHRRKRRKIEQLVVDEISFAGIGAISVIAFWFLTPHPSPWAILISGFEALLLIILGIETFLYSDLSS